MGIPHIPNHNGKLGAAGGKMGLLPGFGIDLHLRKQGIHLVHRLVVGNGGNGIVFVMLARDFDSIYK